MKKSLLLKHFLLLFALVVGSTSVWADEYTTTFSRSGGNLACTGDITYTTTLQPSGNGDARGVQFGTSGSPAGTFTLTAGTSINNISKVVVACCTAAKGSATVDVKIGGSSLGSQASISPNASSADNYTFEGSTLSGIVTIEINASSKAFYLKSVTITYSTGGGSTPSISADNVDIAYNATSGSIAYTINSGVDGGSVSAAVKDGNWITLGEGTASPISFTCSANSETTARTATVTLTYTYNDPAETVIKDVTITQAAAPVVYTTIPALFAAATSTETEVKVTFNDWVVSGVSTNGKNVFVTDNSGNGFVIYSSSDQSSTYSVGDILSGTAVSCSLKKTNGYAQITNLDASDLTITTGGTVSIANITLANLAGVNTGALVSYDNLTCNVSSNKYYLSDGTTTIQLYNSLYAFNALQNGKKYNITGIYQQYSSTKEILPRSADDIEEVLAASIVVNTNSVEATAAETDGTISVTYNNITDVDAEVHFFDANGTTRLTGNNIPSWIQAEINGQNNLYYLIDANDGAARTAYMKVYALDNYGEDVYSELITISQAAYVAPPTPVEGYYKKVTSNDDITDGQYLIVYEEGNVAFDGSLEALDGVGNTIDIEIDNEKIAATTVTKAAEFTIDVAEGKLKSASGLYPGVSSNSNGLNQSDNADTYTHSFSIDDNEDAVIKVLFESSTMTIRYNKANNQTRFRYYKSGQEPVQLYKYYTLAVSAAGYKAYNTTMDTDFSETEGLTAFVVTEASATNITLTEVDAVPAGTPVILKGAAGDYTLKAAESTPDGPAANELQVSNGTVGNGSTHFALGYIGGEVGFYRVGQGVTIPTNYLVIEGVPSGQNAIGFEEGTTGIQNIERTVNDNQYYTLDGRRVAEPTKGLYIINGKKVVIK